MNLLALPVIARVRGQLGKSDPVIAIFRGDVFVFREPQRGQRSRSDERGTEDLNILKTFVLLEGEYHRAIRRWTWSSLRPKGEQDMRNI